MKHAFDNVVTLICLFFCCCLFVLFIIIIVFVKFIFFTEVAWIMLLVAILVARENPQPHHYDSPVHILL